MKYITGLNNHKFNPIYKDKEHYWKTIKMKRNMYNQDFIYEKIEENLKSNENLRSNENNNNYITIVYPPVVDWYMLYQRPHQLCNAFSKIDGVRSIFISNEGFRKLENDMLIINDDFYVINTNVNYKKLIKGKKILWFSYPQNYVYARNDKFDLVVFDSIDNPVEEFVLWSVDLKKAINYSDIISCTTKYLYNTFRNQTKSKFLCPNGADYDHFKKSQGILDRPLDFPVFDDDEIVIGFYGAMASWVDFDLINKIAEKYKVVLIGKNRYYKHDTNHKNVYSIEHKDYKELPYYLAQFDLCLIPFKLTEMINGCDPIKFYEYISSGKPVLSTKIPELVERFSDEIYFIDIENCFDLIEEAIKSETISKKIKRVECAKENCWDVRAKNAYENIMKYL